MLPLAAFGDYEAPGGSPLGLPNDAPWQRLVIMGLSRETRRGRKTAILAEASHHFRRERVRENIQGGSPLGVPSDASGNVL